MKPTSPGTRLIPILALLVAVQCAAQNPPEADVNKPNAAWEKIAPFFKPPKAFEGDLGDYRSPLLFNDDTRVKTPADWQRRRKEILKTWHDLMGPWPEVIAKPKVEVIETKRREDFTQR